jgi:colanic acid biosynthesis protein WcaH
MIGMSDSWIPEPEWQTVVENVPLVSVDLVVRRNGAVLLGKRSNEPAKGYWFVPGGRVHKGERRSDAIHRIATDELGLDVEPVETIGVYNHFYDTADVPVSDGKHYLATGFVVDCNDKDPIVDDQHDAVRFFERPPNQLHEYVRQYLVDAESLPDWL